MCRNFAPLMDLVLGKPINGARFPKTTPISGAKCRAKFIIYNFLH